MKIIHTLAALREQLQGYRHPAVVPTMGNLHAGHIALVHAAKPLGDVTVATIFVNRLQFGPNEDFATYPRTLQADCAQLEAAGCDIVFAPGEQELYPEPQGFLVQPPGELSNILEGQFRPGFFTGVATVVLKLLSCTQARSAVFGKKDYQQLMVVRRLVQQFCLPVDIVGQDTQRAEDGLALSSRNSYLSAAERHEAVRLSQTLRGVCQALREGRRDLAALEQQAMHSLQQAGWQPDYVTVRNQSDLQPPTDAQALVVLGAARLGRTRLIDNMEV